jgi:hypothetical protein
MDELEVIEFGEFVNPLEKTARKYRGQPDKKAIVKALELAIALSEPLERGEAPTKIDPNELDRTRQTSRRNVTVTAQDVSELHTIAEHVGEESYQDQYALMEVVQAAAVGCSSLKQRNESSIRLAVAAKSFRQFERARLAYADTIEGLQIMARFFRVNKAAYTELEDMYQRNWHDLCEHTGTRGGIFDPASTTPEDEWVRLVRWNSDWGSDQGLLAQIDATLRLAIRWEYWRDRKEQPLEIYVEAMAEAWGSKGDETEGTDATSFTANRFLVTVGDALVEIGEWKLAARVYSRLLEQSIEPSSHPIVQHASIQKALCHLMLDDAQECRVQLDTLSREKLERLSELVVTLAAEFARYLAVDHVCRKRLGKPVPDGIRGQLQDLLGKVAVIARQKWDTRTDYLRSLFFAVLLRDIDAIMG